MISKDQFLRIKELSELGLSAKKIALKIGISDTAVRGYVKMTEEDYDKAREESLPEISRYREYMLQLIRVQPRIKTTSIYYELQNKFPDFTASKTTFYRYVQNLREETGYLLSARRQMRMREELPPGYEAQVDFGQMKMKDMYDRTIRVYFFCMVLSYSRMRFVYFSNNPYSTETAIMAHNYAFRYFGGRTQTIMYDQDRVFVVSENFGNIMLVQKFEEYVRKIGFGVILCRPRDPQTKGKVENLVKHVKECFLADRIYTSIDTLNSEVLRWLDTTAGEWHNGVVKQTPRELFKEESKYLIRVPSIEGKLDFRTVSKLYGITYDNCTYILPVEIFKPSQRIRVEEKEGELFFYDASSGAQLYQYRKSTNYGEIVSCGNEIIAVESVSVQSLYHLFNHSPEIKSFVEGIEQENPRYKNAQYRRIMTLCRAYTLEQVCDAVKHCLKVNRCSASEVTAYLFYKYGLRQRGIVMSYYEQKKCQDLAVQIEKEEKNG